MSRTTDDGAAPVPTGPVATRMVSLEALTLLVAARALIAAVRFGRWRGWLGRPVAIAPAGDAASRHDRYLAKAVHRAARRLPIEIKCLPEAMALHWMLARRRRPSLLVVAALPHGQRNGHDDLHAWVELGGEVLIGLTDQDHKPLLRLTWVNP